MAPELLPELQESDFWPDHRDREAVEARFSSIRVRMQETFFEGDIEASLSYCSILWTLGNMFPSDDPRNPMYIQTRQQG